MTYFNEPKAVHWIDDEQAYGEHEDARPREDRERVSRADIDVGDRLDISVPDFIVDSYDEAVTNLYNAEVTEVLTGVFDRDGEYQEDYASEFVAKCDGWTVRVYCDRARWKASYTPPSGDYLPDCGVGQLRQFPEHTAEDFDVAGAYRVVAAVERGEDVETAEDVEDLKDGDRDVMTDGGTDVETAGSDQCTAERNGPEDSDLERTIETDRMAMHETESLIARRLAELLESKGEDRLSRTRRTRYIRLARFYRDMRPSMKLRWYVDNGQTRTH